MKPNDSPTYKEVLANGLDNIDEALGYLLLIQADTDDNLIGRHRKNTLIKLYAGIELVLKARLFLENWTYIFADMNKADRSALKNGDFISIGSDKIASRLLALCDIDVKKLEKESFSKLRNRRNKTVHFIMPTTDKALVSVVNNNVTEIIEFITEQFEQEVLDTIEGKLIDEIHAKLRQSKEHEAVVRNLAQKRLDALILDEEDIHVCPECLEPFFVFSEETDECLYCGLKSAHGAFDICEDCDEVFNRKEAGIPICYKCAKLRFDNDRMLPAPDYPED